MNPVNDSVDKLIESTYEFGRVMRQQMLGHVKGSDGGNLLHIHALFLISEREGITMKQFAQSMHITSPSATSLVNRLVTMRWVGRKHDEDNRKLVKLWLTPLGRKILRQKHEQRREVLRHIFTFLTPAEQAQLSRLHQKLRRALSSRFPH